MNRDFGQSTHAAGDSERRLIDAAWQQFEQLRKPARGSAPGDSRTFHPAGYRILGEIHRGGQGVVYQAIQESTQRKVAIKVLKEGPFADRIELARFEREVDVLSRIDHPHIVAIHDRGLSAGHAYYVMDYIAGQPIDAHVAGSGLSVEDTLELFVKVCEAVSVAHLRGVIHRDLKPGNIRVDVHGEPRILDFGLAKLAKETMGGSSAQTMTLTGQFVGSLPWSSPEQAEGRSDDIDVRSDVYSLGVLLYQLLVGSFPYPVSGRLDEVILHIRQTAPTRPSALRRHVDQDIELILLKSLSKEPERRYQSAGELARDLRHFLAHEPVTATYPSATYRLRKFIKRNRGAVAAGTVVALGLLASTAVSLRFGISEAHQRQAAESARTRAETAESAAQQRAKELEEVAKFQQKQLSDIDAKAMGMRLRSDLLSKARAVAERSKLTPEEVDARVNEIDRLISGSDFTGMALDALRKSFFDPAAAVIRTQFSAQPLVQARLLQSLAATQQELGLTDSAEGPQQEALAIRRRTLGNDDADTVESINDMGILLQAQGKLTEAEALFREALGNGRKALGEQHLEVLSALNNLAGALYAQGKLPEAESYCREAYEDQRRYLGEEHPDTMSSMNNLGVYLVEQGKLDEAEPYQRGALELRRRVLGDEHRHTLNSINCMAMLLKTQGKLAEAEPYFREALETRRRVLGDDHPDTLNSVQNLSNLLSERGKLAEAEPYFVEALETNRRVLGEDHPATLRAVGGVGILLYSEGKMAEAEPYLRDCVAGQRRILGNEHFDTLGSINNLGVCLRAQGKLDEAEALYAEALETRRRVNGPEHPETLLAINNLVALRQAQGRLDEAESLARESLDVHRRVLGSEHPKTLALISNLGVILQARGMLDEAEPLMREALEGRRRVLGEEHPQTLVSLHNMGGFLRLRKNFAEAEAMYREAYEKQRKLLGSENANTFNSMFSLAGVLNALNRPAEAAELLTPAEPAARRVYTGGNLFRLGQFLTTLGKSHTDLGEFELAESELNEGFEILAGAKAGPAVDRTLSMTLLAELYEAWNAAEPNDAHRAKAAEWRAKLNAASSPSP